MWAISITTKIVTFPGCFVFHYSWGKGGGRRGWEWNINDSTNIFFPFSYFLSSNLTEGRGGGGGGGASYYSGKAIWRPKAPSSSSSLPHSLPHSSLSSLQHTHTHSTHSPSYVKNSSPAFPSPSPSSQTTIKRTVRVFKIHCAHFLPHLPLEPARLYWAFSIPQCIFRGRGGCQMRS